MLIDSHIHLTEDGKWFETTYDASVERALREMDAAGIEMAGVIPIADKNNRAFCIETSLKYSDRFYSGYTLTATDDAEFDDLKACYEQGVFRFVKVHPRQSGILPTSPSLARFLEFSQDKSIPVVFCTYMRGPKLPMSNLTPLVFDEIASAYPKLRIVLAHSGSYRPLDALAVAQSHKNVYLELSHVLEYFKGSSLEADFQYIMSKLDLKVIYGSDFPEMPIDSYFWSAQEMQAKLLNSDTKKIFGQTAADLFLS